MSVFCLMLPLSNVHDVARLEHKESRWRLTSNVFNKKRRRAKSATILLLYNYCTRCTLKASNEMAVVTVWTKMTVSTSDHELARVILSFWRRVHS